MPFKKAQKRQKVDLSDWTTVTYSNLETVQTKIDSLKSQQKQLAYEVIVIKHHPDASKIDQTGSDRRLKDLRDTRLQTIPKEVAEIKRKLAVEEERAKLFEEVEAAEAEKEKEEEAKEKALYEARKSSLRWKTGQPPPPEGRFRYSFRTECRIADCRDMEDIYQSRIRKAVDELRAHPGIEDEEAKLNSLKTLTSELVGTQARLKRIIAKADGDRKPRDEDAMLNPLRSLRTTDEEESRSWETTGCGDPDCCGSQGSTHTIT